MAQNTSEYAIKVKVSNIKQVSDLKKSLKELRAEQKRLEKEAASGRFQSKKDKKSYKLSEQQNPANTLRCMQG